MRIRYEIENYEDEDNVEKMNEDENEVEVEIPGVHNRNYKCED